MCVVMSFYHRFLLVFKYNHWFVKCQVSVEVSLSVYLRYSQCLHTGMEGVGILWIVSHLLWVYGRLMVYGAFNGVELWGLGW